MPNPKNLLILWTKSLKIHDKGRKPKEFPRVAQSQRELIRKGLIRLKMQATVSLAASPDKQKSFAKTRDQLVRVMVKYLRYVKTAKEEDKRLLQKYMRQVKALTQHVKNIDPAGIDLTEPTPSLESIYTIRTDTVDQALTQPETAEDAETADFAGDADTSDETDEQSTADELSEAGEAAIPEASEASPAETDADRWQRQYQELEPKILQALREKSGDWNRIRVVMAFAQGKAEAEAYGPALQALETLGKLVATALAPPETSSTQPETETAPKTPRPRAGTPADFPRLWTAAKESWQTASDTVDAQISQLQNALKATGFDEMKEISEFGLNGATGNFKVPLMAVMRNVDATAGDARQKEIVKAKKVVAGFKQHLQKSEVVAVCDDNPFDVTVTIRQTLSAALDELESALETV